MQKIRQYICLIFLYIDKLKSVTSSCAVRSSSFRFLWIHAHMMIWEWEAQNIVLHWKSISLKLYSTPTQIPPSGQIELLRQEENIAFL